LAFVLRPLSIGELLDQTFSLYRNHFTLFAGIFVFPQLAVFAVSFGMQLIVHAASSTPSAAMVAGLSVLLYIPIFLATLLVTLAVGQAATVYAVSQVYLDRPTSISQCYSFVKLRFWSILIVVLLVMMAGAVSGVVGLLALLVGAIVLPVLVALYTAFAIPVTVLEGRDPIESIKRSFYLAKGDLGRIFLIWLLFTVLQVAAAWLISVPTIVFAAMFQQHGDVPLWLNALGDLGNFVVAVLVRPFLTIAFSVAYYDERVRKEALDMQFMMAAIDRDAVPSRAAAAGNTPISSG